jgi:hypothetical protein
MSSDEVSGQASLHIVDLAQGPLQPWRNGGGVAPECMVWISRVSWSAVFCAGGAELKRDGQAVGSLSPGSMARCDNAAHHRLGLRAPNSPLRAWWMHFWRLATVEST